MCDGKCQNVGHQNIKHVVRSGGIVGSQWLKNPPRGDDWVRMACFLKKLPVSVAGDRLITLCLGVLLPTGFLAGATRSLGDLVPLIMVQQKDLLGFREPVRRGCFTVTAWITF